MEIDLYGPLGHPELRGDVSVSEALADEVDKFPFSWSERGRARRTLLGLTNSLLNFGIETLFALAHLFHTIQKKRGIGCLQHDRFG